MCDTEEKRRRKRRSRWRRKRRRKTEEEEDEEGNPAAKLSELTCRTRAVKLMGRLCPMLFRCSRKPVMRAELRVRSTSIRCSLAVYS